MFYRLGLDQVSSQDERVVFLHYDLWIGCKQGRNENAKWISARGGAHINKHVMDLFNSTIDACAELQQAWNEN